MKTIINNARSVKTVCFDNIKRGQVIMISTERNRGNDGATFLMIHSLEYGMRNPSHAVAVQLNGDKRMSYKQLKTYTRDLTIYRGKITGARAAHMTKDICQDDYWLSGTVNPLKCLDEVEIGAVYVVNDSDSIVPVLCVHSVNFAEQHDETAFLVGLGVEGARYNINEIDADELFPVVIKDVTITI